MQARKVYTKQSIKNKSP